MTATAIDFSLLEQVRPGHELRLRFRSDRLGDLGYLQTMLIRGDLEASPGQQAVMEAVWRSGDWSRDENRTVVVTTTAEFDPEFFEGRMSRALESLEFDHVVTKST